MDKLDLYKEAAIFMPARAHMWHLNTNSYAQHKALGTFYEDLTGLVDSFIEGCMAYYNVVQPTGQSYTFTTSEDAVEGLSQFLNITQQVHTELQDKPGLTNILEDILSLTEKTLYKLQHLQ